jgi:hypothetical protein
MLDQEFATLMVATPDAKVIPGPPSLWGVFEKPCV